MPEIVLPKTRAKFVAICDGDDFWVDQSKLEKQIYFLENNPSYSICYSDINTIDEKGNDLAFYVSGARRDLTEFELKIGTPINTSTACFRNVFHNLKYPDELKRAEYGDLTLWTILGFYGKGKYLDNILPCKYRIHLNSIHSSKSNNGHAFSKLYNDIAIYKYNLNKGEYRAAHIKLFEVLMFAIRNLGIYGFMWSFYQALIRKLRNVIKLINH